MIFELDLYFREMNMPTILIESMKTIPSKNMLTFSSFSTQAREYGFTPYDPAYEEMTIIQQANIYGINSLTYRKRQQELDNKCPILSMFDSNFKVIHSLSELQKNIDDYPLCIEIILSGLSREKTVKFMDLKKSCSGMSRKDFLVCAKEKYNLVTGK